MWPQKYSACRLLGPIRMLPTLHEGGEESHDTLSHGAPPLPTPPPLPLPSPPHLPPFDAPSSGPGEPQGFCSEDFLTQRVPLRPSQVVTEQTAAVHAWLREECARQHGKRRRLGSGAAAASETPPDREAVSLLDGTAAMSRGDAAKAFYQALGAIPAT